METLTIRHGKVYIDGYFTETDIHISNGKIVAFSSPAEDTGQIIDASGKYVVPGFTDLHAHFREPGFEYKETIRTGTIAAAAGGYTTVCTMPNLNPVPDSPEHLQVQLNAIRKDAVIEVLPFASITVGEKGEKLVPFAALAKDCIGFSDDGRGVQSAALMKAAMEKCAACDKLISAHCEDNSLAAGGTIHAGKKALEFGIGGISSDSEYLPVIRDIGLAGETGVQYHICHISASETIEAVRRGKMAGVRVTCEVTPHQIALCEDDITENIGRFKMNPPLRTRGDRDAILQGIKDGTIDCIATDHAPHSEEEKRGDFTESLFGIVGLETAFSVCHTVLVKKGIISLEDLIELMSIRPAKILGRQAGIRPGVRADIAILDTEAVYTVDPGKFYSKGRSTPFDGMTLKGRVATTIANGVLVYTA